LEKHKKIKLSKKKMKSNQQTRTNTTPMTTPASNVSSVPSGILTKKLQSEIEFLSKKVVSMDQQVSSRVHIVSELIDEVLSRWRSSTSLALHTISTLEQELLRKTEALRDAHAKSADREATLVSSEAEKEAIRVYATRLEGHLGRLVEASVAAVNTASSDSNSLPIQKPIIAALQHLMNETALNKADNTQNSTRSVSTSGDIDGLQNAVRSGDTTVSLFFANLDATYPSLSSTSTSTTSSSTSRSIMNRTSENEQNSIINSERSSRTIDVTLSRALDFAREKALAEENIETTTLQRTSHLNDNTSSTPSSSSSSSSSSLSSSAILEIEFDTDRHSEATVQQLIEALSIKAGRTVSKVKFQGKFLTNENAKLIDIGVPVKASIEVQFEYKTTSQTTTTTNSTHHSTANIESSRFESVVKTNSHLPPPIPTLHIPKNADPLPVHAKLLPPPKRQPLVSPTPHEAPKTLRDQQNQQSITKQDDMPPQDLSIEYSRDLSPVSI
jgi:hypothetical protein